MVHCQATVLPEGVLSNDGRIVRPGGVTLRYPVLALFDARTGDRERIGTIENVRLAGMSWIGEVDVPEDLVGCYLGADLGFTSWDENVSLDVRGIKLELYVIEAAVLIGCSVVNVPAFAACRIERAL